MSGSEQVPQPTQEGAPSPDGPPFNPVPQIPQQPPTPQEFLQGLQAMANHLTIGQQQLFQQQQEAVRAFQSGSHHSSQFISATENVCRRRGRV